MSISGLAITLCDRPDDARSAVLAMEAHPAVEIGPREGRRLAATTDTTSPRDDRALWHWVGELTGVELVDVVYVHFDEPAMTHRENES